MVLDMLDAEEVVRLFFEGLRKWRQRVAAAVVEKDWHLGMTVTAVEEEG
eukprot:COSAG02_NODE_48774_length_331_cov_0.896552_1_plen_49_part_00